MGESGRYVVDFTRSIPIKWGVIDTTKGREIVSMHATKEEAEAEAARLNAE